MASGSLHDEHIAMLFGTDFAQDRTQDLYAVQDAVYLLTDLTARDKNGPRASRALKRLQEMNIAQVLPDDIAAFESSASTHQYYAHLGWNYDYETEGLRSQEQTEEWRQWTEVQKQSFRTYLASCAHRFALGKDILCKTMVYIFPALSPSRTDALARLCYYTHIYGDLRWNSRLDYLMDIPQFKAELSAAVTDFYTGSPAFVHKAQMLKSHIEKELSPGLVFTIPAAGDNAPLEEWKHCLPLDRTMEKIWGIGKDIPLYK